ncbi:MAG TPA: DUF1365 domain-containing protein, partial [Nevskiales bacterium]|nr:DUF1365 domain-containing protein [Nevskiales bacterium]
PSRVTHLRQHPVRYRFGYRLFYLLLDLDRLAESASRLRLFSYNRWNLFSFHDRDHGPHDGRPLRPWLEELLRAQGIELAGGRVRLLCLPRVLGYVFNPISIYYCEHRDGTLRAILCEVHNTFGERHCYLLSRNGAAMDYDMPQRKAKLFHVSPLIGMSGEYRFRLSAPEESFRILIRLYPPAAEAAAGGPHWLLAAALQGERRPLTDAQLLRQFLRMPLMTLKVTAAIHWQALKIWLRGAPFFRKPQPPLQEVS